MSLRLIPSLVARERESNNEIPATVKYALHLLYVLRIQQAGGKVLWVM
jgi:hypothetical protein